jgi:nicotinate-nucleotide adenylyltransferase
MNYPVFRAEGRIGLFGGSFDPPHRGHLSIASRAADELNLDQIAFIPALHPPHKAAGSLTSFLLRSRMLELCLPEDPRFRLCLVEANEPLSGRTVDTIKKLRELGFTEDHCHLIWLMGSDSLLELATWHQPEELIQSVEVAILPRPGFPPEKASERYLSNVRVLRIPMLEISASAIRERRIPLADAVTRPVEEFIREHKLYGYE